MMEVSLIFVICGSVLLFVDFVFRIYKKFEIIKMGKQKATAASRIEHTRAQRQSTIAHASSTEWTPPRLNISLKIMRLIVAYRKKEQECKECF